MIVTTADNLPRLLKCGGSRNMPPSFDRDATPNPLRDEGIAAHWAAAEVFKGMITLEEVADRKAPNGVYITHDIADMVDAYLGALDCGEVEADTSFVGPGYQINGRCDHWNWNPQTLTLTVDDLKTGWGIVEVEGHWTLAAHAIGLSYRLAAQGMTPQRVELRIHQPRPHHPDGKLRVWRLTYAQLLEVCADLNARMAALTDELNTDVDLCRKCWAAATCPAYRMATYNAIDANSRFYSDDFDGDLLAHEINIAESAAQFAKDRLAALKELGLHRIKQGQIVPNYASEKTQGNRAWKPGLDPKSISLILGVNVEKSGFATPAEAKRRGANEHVIKSLTYRPETGTKLVRVTADTRARRMFNK